MDLLWGGQVSGLACLSPSPCRSVGSISASRKEGSVSAKVKSLILLTKFSSSFREGSPGRKWVSKQEGMVCCELVESVQKNRRCFQQKTNFSSLHIRHHCLDSKLGQSCCMKQTRGINKSRAVKHSLMRSKNISHCQFVNGKNLSMSPFKSPWNLQVRNNLFPGSLYYNSF